MGCGASKAAGVAPKEHEAEAGAEGERRKRGSLSRRRSSAAGAVTAPLTDAEKHVRLVKTVLVSVLSRMNDTVTVHRERFAAVAARRGLDCVSDTMGAHAFVAVFEAHLDGRAREASPHERPSQRRSGELQRWVQAGEKYEVRAGKAEAFLAAVEVAAQECEARLAESIEWCGTSDPPMPELSDVLSLFLRAMRLLFCRIGEPAEFGAHIDEYIAE